MDSARYSFAISPGNRQGVGQAVASNSVLRAGPLRRAAIEYSDYPYE
jgi:hypothetical protein